MTDKQELILRRSAWNLRQQVHNLLASAGHRRTELAKVTAERDEARNLADRLKLEAQIHAQEARTIRAAIDALNDLTETVGNMRVPQSIADAGLQLTITIGPALENARSALAQLRSLIAGKETDVG